MRLIFVDARFNSSNELVTSRKSNVDIYWEDVLTTLEYETGTSRFITPLSIQSNTSSYSVTIDDVLNHTLELQYELDEILDLDHRMTIRALNIESVSHSFDSLVFECGINGCIDKETTITCYF